MNNEAPRITVVIPTYNRRECIKLLIDECINQYCGNLFSFEVHDSSQTEDTREIVLQSGKISYYHYEPDINGDEKTMRALQNVKTQYVYLLGDGILIDFNRLEKALYKNCFYKYSILGLIPNNWIKRYKYLLAHATEQSNDVYVWKSAKEYLNDAFWYLTLYGASIVEKKVFIDNEYIEKFAEINSPFRYICSVFSGLAKETFMGCLLSTKDYMHSNPQKKASGWIVGGQAIKIFCYQYYESVSLLPSIYQSQRKEFLFSHNKRTRLFIGKSLLRLRATKNITFSIIKDYYPYIKITIPLFHRVAMYSMLLVPYKLLEVMYKVYKKIKLSVAS